MDDESLPPGVTLHLESAQISGKIGRVVLTADVDDNKLYEEVVSKFKNDGKGMRIYTVSSFAEEALDVLQGRLEQKDVELERALAEKDEHIAKLTQQADFHRAEAATLRQQLSALQSAHAVKSKA